MFNEALAYLSNLAFVEGIHPLPAYLELCRLVGQLSIFHATRRPPDLPRYNHDDLGGCFHRIKHYLDELIDIARSPTTRSATSSAAACGCRSTSSRPGWTGASRCSSASQPAGARPVRRADGRDWT